MQTKLQKWGNSVGVRIPKAFLKEIDLSEGEWVELNLHEGKITLSKTKPTLEDLVEKITPQNLHPEMDSGALMGKELW